MITAFDTVHNNDDAPRSFADLSRVIQRERSSDVRDASQQETERRSQDEKKKVKVTIYRPVEEKDEEQAAGSSDSKDAIEEETDAHFQDTILWS